MWKASISYDVVYLLTGFIMWYDVDQCLETQVLSRVGKLYLCNVDLIWVQISTQRIMILLRYTYRYIKE